MHTTTRGRYTRYAGRGMPCNRVSRIYKRRRRKGMTGTSNKGETLFFNAIEYGIANRQEQRVKEKPSSMPLNDETKDQATVIQS